MEPTELLRTLRNRPQNGARRDWFSIRNLNQGETEVFLYDIIGDSWFGGISAQDFVRELRGVVADKILLRINSPGGDVADGVTIRNAIAEHPATVEAHVDGLAASTASWIALAADTVIMSPKATMMIHDPFDFVGGDAETLAKAAAVLNKFGDQIASMYAEKAGGKVEDWREKMRAETWYTDQEAVAAGLADSIGGAAVAQNRYDPAILNIFKRPPKHLTEPTNNNPHPEAVRAVLEYQRDWTRRLGVAS